MMLLQALAAALLLPALVAGAEPTQPGPQVGDTYEITSDRESSQQTSGGSSSSSTDRDTLTERVVGVRPSGLELEFDLPKQASAEDRAGNWQFPARVFEPFHGPVQLLNQPELEGRVDGWLKKAGLTRAACGQWIFTWTAFRIECDPQSVIQTLESFDLGLAELREGASYQDPGARGPAPLTQKTVGRDGATFVVEMAVDADTVRRDQAEADVVVAEISRKTLSLDAALRARSAEDISGTITITLDTDSTGRVRRRTKVTKLEIKGQDQPLETQTTTETVERSLVSRLKP